MLARTKGDKVERFALKYLTRKGLSLIEQNFNSRYGEIDLVMLDKSTLVFVEVRFRAKSSHGSGAESVDYRKQQKIISSSRVATRATFWYFSKCLHLRDILIFGSSEEIS